MKNTVTQEQIKEIMSNAEIKIQTVEGKTTIVHCVLPNGFVIVDSSSCVDPANYDEVIGSEICLKRIENKVWELEGYVLQNLLYLQDEVGIVTEEPEEVSFDESVNALSMTSSYDHENVYHLFEILRVTDKEEDWDFRKLVKDKLIKLLNL